MFFLCGLSATRSYYFETKQVNIICRKLLLSTTILVVHNALLDILFIIILSNYKLISFIQIFIIIILEYSN